MENEDMIKNALGHITQNIADITTQIDTLCIEIRRSLTELAYNIEQIQKAMEADT